MRIGLIGCCKQKLAVPAPAQDLYLSLLFKKARAYAETHCDQWAILSAEHHLVLPTQVIAPYDRCLDRLTVGQRRGWQAMTCMKLRDQWPDYAQHTFVVVAGEHYCWWWTYTKYWEAPFTVERPFKGLGIGQLLRALG